MTENAPLLLCCYLHKYELSLIHIFVKGGRLDADAFVPRAAQHSFLVLERGGNGINKRHAVARVDAAAENVQRMEGRFDTQRRRCLLYTSRRL